MLTGSPILRRIGCNLQLHHTSAQHLKVCTRNLRPVVDEHVDESSQYANCPDDDCSIEVVPASKQLVAVNKEETGEHDCGDDVKPLESLVVPLAEDWETCPAKPGQQDQQCCTGPVVYPDIR